MSRQAIAPYNPRTASARSGKGAAGKRQKQPRSAGNWMMIVLLLLFLVIAAGLFLPTSMILGAAMIPSLVALLIDQDPDKMGAITVASINFCGALPSAMSLWSGNNSVPHAMSLLSDPMNWMVMYGAAAIGWTIYYVVPPIISGCVVRRHEGEIARLTEHQEKLVAEWGPNVSGPSGQSESSSS